MNFKADITRELEMERMTEHGMERAVERMLNHFSKVKMFEPEIIAGTMGRQRLERLIAETPGDIAFMREVLKAAIKQDRLRSS